jgi:hypothetical protein
VDLEFAQGCHLLLVANRGRPSTVASNTWLDPEGTITKIGIPTVLNEDSIFSVTTITFHDSFVGNPPNQDIM